MKEYMKRIKIWVCMILVVLLLPIDTVSVWAVANNETTSEQLFEISNGELTKYNGSEAIVYIPEEVKTIGMGAFINNTSVEKVVISGNTTRVGMNAFKGCTALKEVQLSSAVEEIGYGSFLDTALTSITIPNKDAFIARESFFYLTDVNHDFVVRGNIGSSTQAFAYMTMIKFEAIDGLVSIDYNKDGEEGCMTATISANDLAIDILNEYYLEKYPDMALDYTFGTPEDRKFFSGLSQTIIEENTDKTPVKAIYDWVDAYCVPVEDRKYFYPMDVYRTRSADCVGQAQLLCELYQSAGFPAVIALGIVGDMKNDVTPLRLVTCENVIGHAWVYVYYDGQWILADTAYDFFFTDRENMYEWYYPCKIDNCFFYHPYVGLAHYDYTVGVSHYKGGLVSYRCGDFGVDGGAGYYVMLDEWNARWYRAEIRSEETGEVLSTTFGKQGLYKYGDSYHYMRSNTWIQTSSILEIGGERYYFESQNGHAFKILDSEEIELFGGMPYIRVGDTIHIEPVVAKDKTIAEIEWTPMEKWSDFCGEFEVAEDGGLTCVTQGCVGYDVTAKDEDGNIIATANIFMYGYEPVTELHLEQEYVYFEDYNEKIINIIPDVENIYDMPYLVEVECEEIANAYYLPDGKVRIVPYKNGVTSLKVISTAGDNISVSCPIIVGEDACPHNKVTIPAQKETCTQDGMSEGTICEWCKKIIVEQEVISASGHRWDEGVVIIESTKEHEGKKRFTCSACGGIKEETIGKLPSSDNSGSTTDEEKTFENETAPSVGDVIEKTDDKGVYSVTNVDENKKEVTYEGSTDKKSKVVKIPDVITINDEEYKVTEISDNAFKNNKKITTVSIGNNVTKVGNNAFAGCKKLKKVTLGKNVKKLGKNVFKGCSKLKTITIKSTKLSNSNVNKNAFAGIKKGTTIKVPKKKLAYYKKLFKKKGLNKKVKVKS